MDTLKSENKRMGEQSKAKKYEHTQSHSVYGTPLLYYTAPHLAEAIFDVFFRIWEIPAKYDKICWRNLR